ncbi:MAG: hypothetical protein U5J63_03940 [Fodinibius sp.]|nr:hypothetical protein [Fodinibius sp.]
MPLKPHGGVSSFADDLNRALRFKPAMTAKSLALTDAEADARIQTADNSGQCGTKHRLEHAKTPLKYVCSLNWRIILVLLRNAPLTLSLSMAVQALISSLKPLMKQGLLTAGITTSAARMAVIWLLIDEPPRRHATPL